MASDWEEVNLGDLFEQSNQGVNTTTEKVEYSDDGLIVIRAKNISAYSIDYQDVVHVSEETFDKLKSAVKPKCGDILFTNIGSQLGSAALVKNNSNFIIAWNVFRIVPNLCKVNAKFLESFLNSEETGNLVRGLNASSTMPFISGKVLRGIKLNLPPLPEQKAIAHILGSLDDKIELNRQMNETLEAMAQALFKSWFVDFDPVIDNALAAGNAIPDAFAKRAEQRKGIEKKDHSDTQNLFPDEFEFTDEMGWIPKGWEVKESGDLFDVRDGTHDSPKKSDEGKYLITSRHITSGVIDYPNAYLISQDDFDEVNKRSLVESYDILITMIGTVGVSMLVLQDEIDFAIKNVGLFKTSNNKSYAVFFYLYLNSNYMTQFLDSRLAGTTQKYLTLKVLRALPVVTPDNKTLSHFVNNMSPIFKKIHSNHEQIGILAKLRDTLLPKLMSGEIRIPDAAAMVEEV